MSTGDRDSGAQQRQGDEHEEVFWAQLRATTRARIGLGRAGDALPTARVLEFRVAHAAARDAVHTPLDVPALSERLAALGLGEPVHVRSRARDRAEYLRRPDLGREPEHLDRLPTPAIADRTPVSGTGPHAGRAGAGSGPAGTRPGGHGVPAFEPADIGVVLADGLSARALAEHGPAMLSALIDELAPHYSFAPPVIATQARVALGDHIAAASGVTTVLVLIGERPGLSVADSLGIYLTHLPRPGRTDAERNCVSNIHPPDGLGYRSAAQVVAGLVAGARRLGRSGVALKDTSRSPALDEGTGDAATPAELG
ncbi:ethanolamine ammonia-lyase subunit EutC [Nocardia donostiensis]|uniref:Ethanolamine ammonia-lyase small subunit n=1 Tax=Nocardia donostiensis TaxID=1538463 RepID=A0A1W0ATX3_9NOCA|nr:ethanolamine ammonia-lyase subunit EutC [Nocardia donostiensis]ONM47739.1 ethanolamine ammonia-lyase [Nocardia donostiensis]OQS13670.1 ethanolamine ammonia-lyase [Nocardia donostiensis]OQS22491.1 ethanolamine ammonia-lyase [Nocardia donostiensis]